MNDMQIATSMAEFAMNSLTVAERTAQLLQSVTLYFLKKLEDQESRRQILDFYQAGTKEEQYLKEGQKLEILSYSINPQYAKTLFQICKRENIAVMGTKVNTFDLEMDGKGDNIKTSSDNVWIYNTRQDQFNLAVAEAKARNGFVQEINMDIARNFAGNMAKDGNPMKCIKGLSYEEYLYIRQSIQKLPENLRFTLFPEEVDVNGTKMINLGFLSHTEPKFDRRGIYYEEDKQYDIPQMIKTIIANRNLSILKDNCIKLDNYILEKDQFRKDTVKDLLEKRTDNPISLKIRLGKMNITKDELAIANMAIDSYIRDGNKDALYRKINELKTLPKNEKKELLMSIAKNFGQAIFIVPIMTNQEQSDLTVELNKNECMCVGNELIIQTKGKEDLIIDNEESLENNINRKLIEYSERTDGNKTGGFLILNQEEYDQIQNGNPDFIRENNRLNMKMLSFLKEKNDKYKKLLEAEHELYQNSELDVVKSIEVDKDLYDVENTENNTIDDIINTINDTQQNPEIEKNLKELEEAFKMTDEYKIENATINDYNYSHDNHYGQNRDSKERETDNDERTR